MLIRYRMSKSAAQLRRFTATLILALPRLAASSGDAFGPLWTYNGSWDIKRSDSADPDHLVNHCALIGQYFACQQTVNGTPGNLVVFVATSTAGQYRTQNVTPSGRATGVADLQIQGNTWTYSNTWDQGGKTTWYKTVNVFSGTNHIHFEQMESTNDRDWTTKVTGDEQRTGTVPAKMIVR
jgi:hypothetical protein